MTSVPKPLKFLRPHYPDLQALYEKWPPSEDKVSGTFGRFYEFIQRFSQSLFADILSVLAMTYSDTQPRGTLRYRLLSASLVPVSSPLSEPGSWGHEYVRHLAAELGEEYSSRVEDEGDTPEEAAEKEKEKEVEGEEKEGEEKKEKSVVKVVIEASNEELQTLGMQCAVFLLGHNAEPDAVDLLEELEIVDRIAELVDENTYARVCAYMIRSVYYTFRL